MNVWAAIGITAVLVWVVGAVGMAAALWERERLLNEEGRRDWKWAGALAFSAMSWPILSLLWARSRPVPPQPEDEHDGYLGAISEGVYIHPRDIPLTEYDFSGEYHAVPGWQYMPPEAQAAYSGAVVVDRPHTLALCGRIPSGGRAFVKSLGFVLTRHDMYWTGACGCRYNFSGFPVTICRQHRNDQDPQGEPDEDEESVGR